MMFESNYIIEEEIKAQNQYVIKLIVFRSWLMHGSVSKPKEREHIDRSLYIVYVACIYATSQWTIGKTIYILQF